MNLVEKVDIRAALHLIHLWYEYTYVEELWDSLVINRSGHFVNLELALILRKWFVKVDL